MSTTNLSKRKKRKCLTFKQKAELIQRLKDGVSYEVIERDYGICKSTAYKLWSQEEYVADQINSNLTVNRKTSKSCKVKAIDEAVIQWFHQTKERGDPVSGPLLQEKARTFNQKFNLSPDFKASTGWLEKFKKRYGINKYTLEEERQPNDSESTKNFSDILNKKIRQENLCLENIYNADESGLFWKTLISYTLSQSTKEVLDRRKVMDRVTSMFCANASGNHRLPLLIIGNSATPCCLDKIITPDLRKKRLKFLQLFGIIYTDQSNAWMDATIFRLWYTEVFMPSVTEHQRVSGKSGKVILILNNTPTHPNVDELNRLDPNFEIIYLPTNISTTVQPMDQGAIFLTKKYYKHKLLKRALFHCRGTLEFLNEINLSDCFSTLNDAWNSLHNSTLSKIWKPLLGETCLMNKDISLVDRPRRSNVKNVNTVTDGSAIFPEQICNKLSKNLAGSEQTVEEVKEESCQWFYSDDSEGS